MSDADLCNCAALRQAARHVSKLYDDALAPIGLGVNQYSILGRLNRLGSATIQELARALVMDRSTLGHLLRPLQARGLVRIDVSKEDRRGRKLVLTAAGKALVAKARPLWAKAQARFETQMGSAEAADLRGVLKRVAGEDFYRAKTANAEG